MSHRDKICGSGRLEAPAVAMQRRPEASNRVISESGASKTVRARCVIRDSSVADCPAKGSLCGAAGAEDAVGIIFGAAASEPGPPTFVIDPKRFAMVPPTHGRSPDRPI